MSFNKALIFAAIIIGAVAFFKNKMNNNPSEFASQYVEENVENDSKQEFTIHRADFNLASFSTIKRSRTPERVLIKASDGSEIPVSIKNITYCEGENRKVRIYRDNASSILAQTTLKELKNEITAPNFMYEGLGSYIVNFDYVEKLMPQRVEGTANYKYYIEINDNQITIPKDKYSSFREKFKDYLSQNTID
jgi:DNA-binding LytR/AlgR family response regulator